MATNKTRRRLSNGHTISASINNNATQQIKRSYNKTSKEVKNISDADYETFKQPNDPFCNKCLNSETRGLKDTITDMFTTINMVAEELGLKHNDWKITCKKMRDWARKRSARLIHTKKKVNRTKGVV